MSSYQFSLGALDLSLLAARTAVRGEGEPEAVLDWRFVALVA